MFWKRLLRNGRKKARKPAAVTPNAEGAVAVAEAPRQQERPAPATHASRRSERLPVPWFTKAEMAALKDVRDERHLAQIVSRKVPHASREEILFRYHLSRAIFVGDVELPILPQSAAQVMRLSRNPRSEIKDYVRVIESDHSLVRAIMDTANSSFFASLSGSASLDQSIVRIGLRQVDQITMVHALRSKVFRVTGFEGMTQRLVQHSLTSAVASQVVAEANGASRADAFLAGLFHDVGKLILLGLVGDVQRRLKWTAPQQLVESAFDAYHISLGETLCRHWGFPDESCEAVGAHEDPDRASRHPLRGAVYLGNLLAHVLSAPEGSAICPADDPVLLAAPFDFERLTALRRELEQQMSAYEALEPTSSPPIAPA